MPDHSYDADLCDGKAAASYYRHARHVDPSSLPVRASIFAGRQGRAIETPANFIGRRMMRTPGDGVVAPEDQDSCARCPRPLDGVWRAGANVPVLRGAPIVQQFQ